MTPERLKSLSELLEAIGSPAMIIGGLAVAVHGLPRMTWDADVTIAADISDLDRVLKAAGKTGFEPRTEKPEEFVSKTKVLPLHRIADRWEVDLIFAGSPYEIDAISRAKMETIEGVLLPIASPEDLLIHKLVAGRPKDISDAANIVRRKGEQLDRDFVLRFLLEIAEATADDSLAGRAREILG